MLRIVVATLAVSILSLTAADVIACGGSLLTANMFQPDADAKLTSVFPPEDGSAVIRGDSIELYVSTSETRAGALTPHDHTHYDIQRFENEGDRQTAEAGQFTMPDLTGRVRFYFRDPEDNGTYIFCAYAARADHSHLSETVCATFEVANSGMRLYLPRNERTYSASEVLFEFDTYGEDIAYIEYTINDRETQRITDITNLSFDLPPLANGSHTLVVEAYDFDDEILGAPITRTFEVASKLTEDNARKLQKFLKRGQKFLDTDKGEKFLKKAKRLAVKMKKSGGVSADNTNLDEAAIKKVLRLIKKGIKQQSKRKLRKAFKILKGTLE